MLVFSADHPRSGSIALWYVFSGVTPQSGNRVSSSLGNSGVCWTVFAQNRDTAVPAEGNGDLQTLICVLVVRTRRCPRLSNPVPWQNWMAAYLGYTLRMKTLFRGWPVMVHGTHTRRRRSGVCLVFVCQYDNSWTVWDTTMKSVREQDMVKSLYEFENGCVLMHCGARVVVKRRWRSSS